jgi:hypothetical protein
MSLHSQPRSVHRAHIGTTTALWSSPVKSLEGRLYMHMFTVSIVDFVYGLLH